MHFSSMEVVTFAVAASPTPVLNTPEHRLVFGSHSGKDLKIDHRGFIDSLEFIALQGTKFEVINCDSLVWQVKTKEYPSQKLFVDSRFLKKATLETPERQAKLLSPKPFLKKLLSRLGADYVWGGNWFDGIPQLLNFYPPRGEVDFQILKQWQLKGGDCSGLLYEASNGYLPRNTADMHDFGRCVPIDGLCAPEIATLLRPLDLIITPGHVVCVYDQDSTIESRASRGVYRENLLKRLKEIMQTHKPKNRIHGPDHFIARRWHPEI